MIVEKAKSEKGTRVYQAFHVRCHLRQMLIEYLDERD